MAALKASLPVGGWLCPGCEEWNLSFRNLCYRCNGRRAAAGVISRGVRDPRRHDQEPPESDSDDSAALDVRQEEVQEEWEALKPLLRSGRSKRGPGSKKPRPAAGLLRGHSRVFTGLVLGITLRAGPAVLRKPSLLGLRQIILRGCGHADHPRRIIAVRGCASWHRVQQHAAAPFVSWLADPDRLQPCA